MATTFIGIDAAWKADKPSGVAIGYGTSDEATITALVYPKTHAAVADVVREVCSENTIVCIDAPLIATNAVGNRDCESKISREFWRFHASAHSMNRPKFELYGLGHFVDIEFPFPRSRPASSKHCNGLQGDFCHLDTKSLQQKFGS
jgi:hypothetical protein